MMGYLMSLPVRGDLHMVNTVGVFVECMNWDAIVPRGFLVLLLPAIHMWISRDTSSV